MPGFRVSGSGLRREYGNVVDHGSFRVIFRPNVGMYGAQGLRGQGVHLEVKGSRRSVLGADVSSAGGFRTLAGLRV